MSNSKFAIKRIKERENNPQVWDAAHELATEWSFDVSKITFGDAEWRVLNEKWLEAWATGDLKKIDGLAFEMLISCVKTNQHKAGLPMIPFVIYGHYMRAIQWADQMKAKKKSWMEDILPPTDPFKEDFPYSELFYISQAARSKEAIKEAFFNTRTFELLQLWVEDTGIGAEKVWAAFESYLLQNWSSVGRAFDN